MFKVKSKATEHQHRINADTNRCVTCEKTPEEILQED